MKKVILLTLDVALAIFCITGLCVFGYMLQTHDFNTVQTFIIFLFMGIDIFVWCQFHDIIRHNRFV